jgi:predicted metal-dependent peptidase
MEQVVKSVVLTSPFFSLLALRAKLKQVSGRLPGPMSTNGKIIWYDPDKVNALPLECLQFVFKHEIMHRVLGHCVAPPMGYEKKRLAIANDLAVNGTLTAAGETPPDEKVLPGLYPGRGVFFDFPDDATSESYYWLLKKMEEEENEKQQKGKKKQEEQSDDEDSSDRGDDTGNDSGDEQSSGDDDSDKETGDESEDKQNGDHSSGGDDDSDGGQSGDGEEGDAEDSEEGEGNEVEGEDDEDEQEGEDGDDDAGGRSGKGKDRRARSRSESEEDEDGDGDGEDDEEEGEGSGDGGDQEDEESRMIKALEELPQECSDVVSCDEEDVQEERAAIVGDLTLTKMASAMAGNIGGGYGALLEKLLSPPTIPWQRQLRMYMMAREKRRLNYHKPARKNFRTDLILPRRGNRTLGKTVVVSDTSGSMTNILPKVMQELQSLTDTFQNSELYLVMCDARLQSEPIPIGKGQHFDFSKLTFRGFGGTDMSPGFALAETLHPDLIICATDLAFSGFPPKPSVPVVWCIADAYGYGDNPVPYGSKVLIPREECVKK